jgi:uncharacterized damage-inducible protein DinB
MAIFDKISVMSILESLVLEHGKEGVLTRKMLESVPFDNPTWKPHEKSMTIQRLSSHIAEIPSWMMRVLEHDEIDFAKPFPERFYAVSNEELLGKFDGEQAASMAILRASSEEKLLMIWTVRRGDRVFSQMQRFAAIQQWVFGHRIHHRGQLSVYLRLLDIPVPGMYGPSADER